MIGVTLGTMLLTTTARMTREPGLLWRHQEPQEPQEMGDVMGTVARPAGIDGSNAKNYVVAWRRIVSNGRVEVF